MCLFGIVSDRQHRQHHRPEPALHASESGDCGACPYAASVPRDAARPPRSHSRAEASTAINLISKWAATLIRARTFQTRGTEFFTMQSTRVMVGAVVSPAAVHPATARRSPDHATSLANTLDPQVK